ncbi:MAG: HAMP domain-containing histidine kinase [Ignavibacteriae bacterium]|nr:HAMP domain-containing histidine kinase [Ignavibacteriota bacterium]
MNQFVKNILFVTIGLISAISAVLSADSTSYISRTTVLQQIVVNGKQWEGSKEYSDLIICREDTVLFNYGCRVSGGEKVPLLFNTRLTGKTKNQERQQTINSPQCSYIGLPEDTYNFYVQAVAPGNWKASAVLVEFKVNNAEALRRKQEIIRKETAKKNAQVLDSTQVAGMKPLRSSVLFFMIFIGGIIAVGIVFLILRSRSKPLDEQSVEKPIKKSNFILIVSIKKLFSHLIILFKSRSKTNDNLATEQFPNGVTMPENIPVNQQNNEEILAENNRLRAELASLRGQIDAMQTRSDELRSHNRTLEEKIERVTLKKQELEDLAAQKDELFAMVIHDIKNPAGLVKGLVELLRSYDLTANEQNDVMNDLVETSRKIVSLSQEVCKIMALEAGQIRLSMEPWDITDILRSVHRRNDAAAKLKSIEVMLEVPPDLPDVEIDGQRIEEVIDNLLSNAIKFSHRGSSVRLRAKNESNTIIVEVSDNGLGLSEEDIKRAFGRGARLSAAPTAGEPSSGLGLWIVKRIVEEHDGRVWVRSALGKGSTFAFQLPLTHEKVA